jgi:hypothetical protein
MGAYYSSGVINRLMMMMNDPFLHPTSQLVGKSHSRPIVCSSNVLVLRGFAHTRRISRMRSTRKEYFMCTYCKP